MFTSIAQDENWRHKTFFDTPTEKLAKSFERLAYACDRASSKEGDEALQTVHQAVRDADRTIESLHARIRFLEGLSITDELTGLLNRRGFQVELGRAQARATRNGETGLLLLCDLDGFKEVNDRHGHLVGDRVLCAVGRLLQAHTRRSDYVARMGGDEFSILMTDTERRLGEELANKLEAVVNSHALIYRGHEVPISASFGHEVYQGGSCFETTYSSADQALYRSKAPRLATTGLPPGADRVLSDPPHGSDQTCEFTLISNS